jgi:hypothetical protein
MVGRERKPEGIKTVVKAKQKARVWRN